MTSSAPTEVIGLRKMGLGDNVNTWGDPNLNINFDTISRLAKGFQSVTITGDTTVSESSYSSSNQTAVPLIQFNGSPAAAWTYTLPARSNFFVGWNRTGRTATLKLSASSGFDLPDQRIAIVSTDGSTDVYNVTPNLIAAITLTNNRDLVDYAALNTAIANASSTITNPGSVRNSALDTTAGFLSTKLVAAGALSSSTGSAGGNETYNLSVTGLALTEGGTISTTGQTLAVNTKYRINTFSTTAITTIGPSAPAVGDLLGFYKYGTGTHTHNLSGLKRKGSAANPVSSREGGSIWQYTGTDRGWVDL